MFLKPIIPNVTTMKRLRILLGILFFLAPQFLIQKISGQTHERSPLVAPTPPMGWNSWDCFGTTVTEKEVKANADYMAKNLLSHGWKYIVVDIQWYEPNAKAHGYRKDAALITDKYGRLLPASNRFPSSADGKGFKPLADYIHNLGLKFGIHIMRGIPRQAVRQNLPVKGTKLRAQDVADTSSVCPWNTDMYGVKRNAPGGQAYYNSIVELYASWGVDYIKADDMAAFNGKPADENRLDNIDALSKAIKNSGRPIVLSLSPGPASLEQAEFLQSHAQLWRVSDDFWDKWDDIGQQLSLMKRWSKYIAPNSWPDADMLPLGKIGIRAERGDSRSTRFTVDEQYTLMTFWSIFRSPLMFGGNLPDNDSLTVALITNDEVLEVNQHSRNNHEAFSENGIVVWTAVAPDSDNVYVAVCNSSDEDQPSVEIDWAKIGIENKTYAVRDLWSKTNVGSFKNSIYLSIAKHGSRLLKLSN
jgi:alpha-galactosidase